MSYLQVKAFILSKDEPIKSCQDSLSVNIVQNCFAVADGVTNSYHPEVVSQLLCKKFIETKCSMENWETFFCDNILKDICDNWESKVEATESELSGRMLEHAKMKRNNKPHGASTFAGIRLDVYAKTIQYFILGDSTFFTIDKDEKINAFCTNEMVSGTSKIDYNNHPHCICADGRIIGNWKVGTIPLQEGYLMLMTDGCAAWFQDEYFNDKNVVDALWNLQDNADFETLATECRKACKMDDDLALIIIRVEDSSDQHSDIVFCPDSLPMVIIANDDFEIKDDESSNGKIAEQDTTQDLCDNDISDSETNISQIHPLFDFYNLILIK